MSGLTINISYLKSWNGIFKILQLVLGAICVGLIGNEYINVALILVSHTTEMYFLIVTSTFFIGTSLIFISNLISPSAASILPKTIYEFIYHVVASILLLAGSITIMVQINQQGAIVFYYKSLLAASICGLLNTVLYICSAIMGYSTYGDD